MRAQLAYRTTYRYHQPAAGVVQALRLTPRDHEGQHIRQWRVDADVDGAMRESCDAFGNRLAMFYADRPVEAITISVAGEADLTDTAGLIRCAEPLAPAVFRRSTPLTQPDPAIVDLAKRVAGDSPLTELHRLNGAIYEGMRFEVGLTDASTTAARALEAGHGVCQDFAHIFIAAARAMGHPARYVSGHLVRAEEEHQSAGHGWAEALAPDLGWIAFDPANGICATDSYLRVAVGLDYLDAAPIRGARRGGGVEELTVAVRAVEAPRRQSQSQGRAQQSQSQG